MKHLLCLAFVIYITIANANLSQTSEQNSNEDVINLRRSVKNSMDVWIDNLVKANSSQKRRSDENETRARKLEIDTQQVITTKVQGLLRQVANDTWQESKSTIEQRFRERFPKCEEVVVETMLRDISVKFQYDELENPCDNPLLPLFDKLWKMMIKLRLDVRFFARSNYKITHANETDERLLDLENMSKELQTYQNYTMESEERGLKDCFTKFIEKTMKQWEEIQVPGDKCKTVEDYNALFNNTVPEK